ncbi:MAG: glycosyltransferase family 39 protein [Gemmataceae bacterium]|nr:glycosyltransferase family 39 protein [Gemmataceae bacterium]
MSALSAGNVLRLCLRCLNSPAVLVALLVLGIAARCRQYFAAPSFWYDEAYLLVNIYEHSFAELLGPLRCEVITPPFFLWLLRGLYLLLGGGELAMRLVPFVAGLAGLFVLIPLARRLVGSPGWLWVVGLGAVSHHALTLSYDVRAYTCDFLVSVLVLLAAAVVLDRDSTTRGRGWAWSGLLMAAALGPWLSFASTFTLAGASLALLTAACGRRELRRPWLAFNGLLLISACLLWYCQARHLYYPGLREHWGQRFPDLTQPASALRWLFNALVELGHYGTTGMGVPLLLLGGVGLVSVGRRDRALAVLLVAPVAVGVLAAVLRRYPFGDRLLFYAVPCLWLLAAEGITVLWRGGRVAWVAAAVLAVLLLPAAARMGKYLAITAPRAEFREAFAYVHEHEQPGDVWWVAFPEVHEVYHGRARPILSFSTPPRDFAEAVRGRRVWVVAPTPGWLAERAPEVARTLEVFRPVRPRWREFRGLQVLLYEPPEQSAAAPHTMNPR